MSKLDELDKSYERFSEKYGAIWSSKHIDFIHIPEVIKRSMFDQARLEEREAVARTIGLSASTAGLAPKDLAKDEDWKEAVEKIKSSEREAMKKGLDRLEKDVLPTHAEENGYSCAIEDARKFLSTLNNQN